MEDTWRWIPVTAVAPVAWGATYFVTRHYLPPDAPLWGAGLRALPAGLLLLLVARRLPAGSWWWRSLVLGALNFGAFFVLVYLSAQLLPTSVAASVMALAPLVLAALARPLLGERVTARFLVAAAAGVAGVLLVVGPDTAGARLAGVACSLAALLLSSLGAILTTRWRDDVPLVATTSWQLVAAGGVLVVLAAATEGPPPRVGPTGLAAYAAVAVVATAAAFLCWFAGLRHLPAGVVGLVGLLNPVTGVALGVALAAEPLTGRQGAGIVLVLAGIVLGRRRAGSGTAPATAPPRTAAGPAASALSRRAVVPPGPSAACAGTRG